MWTRSSGSTVRPASCRCLTASPRWAVFQEMTMAASRLGPAITVACGYRVNGTCGSLPQIYWNLPQSRQKQMTTIRLKPKMVILAILAAATIGAAAFVAQGLLVRAGDFQSSDFQAGRMATSTSDASDSDILIAKVGESSISLADLKEQKLHATYMESLAQRELDGSGPETGLPTKHLAAVYGVTTKWGVETASLSKLIEDLALFEKAVELGLTATEDEIAENQKRAREAYDNGEYDDYNKGYVESVGEDTYWNDVYPRKAKVSLSISKLRDHVQEEGEAVLYRDAKTLWLAYTETVMDEAKVVLPESTHHSTTLDDVRDYLSDMRDVGRESLLIPAEYLETAPAGTWVIYSMSEDGTVEKTESDEAAVFCYHEDADGNVTRWVCDEATEKVKIADLEGAVLYVIVEPGDPLPVFEK